MQQIHDGQCGLCTHFGEGHNQSSKFVQIRKSMQAPEDLIDNCGHPTHANLHLKVTPVSGCDGFEPAKKN